MPTETDPKNSHAFPSWCGEAWVAVQALRSLGFPADDIYFVLEKNLVGVALKQGEKLFPWGVALRPEGPTDAEVQDTWQRFATSMNECSQQERDAVWTSTDMVQQGGPRYIQLAQALRSKGFAVPDQELTRALDTLDALKARC